MKVIDLLNKKANNELMPQLIKIIWIDYEIEYYLDDNFWYRSIEDDKKLEILPNILNAEVKVITNEYKQMIQKEEIIEEDKEIEIDHYDYVDNPDIMNKNVIAHNFQRLNEDLDLILSEIKTIKTPSKL